MEAHRTHTHPPQPLNISTISPPADGGKAREAALFEERRRQYEELAEKDDAAFKDTVEMAEQTGGWGVCVE